MGKIILRRGDVKNENTKGKLNRRKGDVKTMKILWEISI